MTFHENMFPYASSGNSDVLSETTFSLLFPIPSLSIYPLVVPSFHYINFIRIACVVYQFLFLQLHLVSCLCWVYQFTLLVLFQFFLLLCKVKIFIPLPQFAFSIPVNIHLMITQSKAGIVKPKQFAFSIFVILP